MNRKFNFLRSLPVHRSSQGFLLGVFRGLAEHANFSVLVTRILGFFVLLGIGEALEKIAFSMPVWAIGIYVLLALSMQPPAAPAGYVFDGEATIPVAHHRLQPVFPGSRAPSSVDAGAPRPTDLKALEQRLESLGRRIAKMENVVVTRERDWDRRLGA